MAPRHAITREKRDRMLVALRGGALYRDAAEAAGIPWSGGRRSHGVAVDDVARMLGLRVEDVCVLAGVEGAS